MAAEARVAQERYCHGERAKMGRSLFYCPAQGGKESEKRSDVHGILATSYGGQLLEILFTGNTDPSPGLKDKIDKVIESVKLQD